MKSCTFGRTPSSVEGGKGVVKREEEDQAFLSSRRQESKREREREEAANYQGSGVYFGNWI